MFLFFCAIPVSAAEADRFSLFSMTLPQGWDGEEQSGFVSGNPDEYQLTLGRLNDDGERFIAQISIFLLPNKNGLTAEEAATQLMSAQEDVSGLEREGLLWKFSGEPRTHAVDGRAQTFVNATPEKMLIIISQGPENLGAARIMETLAGRTDETRKLLGR